MTYSCNPFAQLDKQANKPSKKAETPEQMRAEIYNLCREDHLIRNVMMMADFNGLSAEDRYTILAYYMLIDRNQYKRLVFDQTKFTTIKSVYQPADK